MLAVPLYKYLSLSLAIADLMGIFVAFRVKRLFSQILLGFPWYWKSWGLLRSIFFMAPTLPNCLHCWLILMTCYFVILLWFNCIFTYFGTIFYITVTINGQHVINWWCFIWCLKFKNINHNECRYNLFLIYLQNFPIFQFSTFCFSTLTSRKN